MGAFKIVDIFCDEAGFTGYNYLDKNQPFFSIASHSFDEKECYSLLEDLFPKYRGAELKFSALWKPKFFDSFCELSEKLTAMPNRIFIWSNDKKLILLTKMFDHLVEPVFSTAGFDFYANGFCKKLVNLAYFEFAKEPKLKLELLKSYSQFSRFPNTKSLNDFFSLLKKLRLSSTPVTAKYLSWLIEGTRIFNTHSDIETFRETNEIHVTTLFGISEHWSNELGPNLRIFHDETAHLLRNKDLFLQITDPKVKASIVPSGQERPTSFPIGVSSLTFQNSAESLPIQFADLLAGYFNKIRSLNLNDSEKALIKNCSKSGFGAVVGNGILHDYVFPEANLPLRLNGPDQVDQFTQAIFSKT